MTIRNNVEEEQEEDDENVFLLSTTVAATAKTTTARTYDTRPNTSKVRERLEVRGDYRLVAVTAAIVSTKSTTRTLSSIKLNSSTKQRKYMKNRIS